MIRYVWDELFNGDPVWILLGRFTSQDWIGSQCIRPDMWWRLTDNDLHCATGYQLQGICEFLLGLISSSLERATSVGFLYQQIMMLPNGAPPRWLIQTLFKLPWFMEERKELQSYGRPVCSAILCLNLWSVRL